MSVTCNENKLVRYFDFMLLLRVQVINSGEILLVYLLYDSTTNIILILLKVIGVFTYGHVGYTVYQLPSNKF